MNIQKNAKKFILVLVLLILFNFCYPKKVNAALGWDDIVAAPAAIFYALEKGLLITANNWFTKDEYHSTTTISDVEGENANGGDTRTETIKVYLTPETIIKGKFLLLDANIFKQINDDAGYYDYEEGESVVLGKIALREIISGWYYALRNFAIIALLSVLVYVGIRMILTSVAQDKAKYKTMFKDWLVALCLLVMMHYMMIGILNISSLITEAVGGGENSSHIEYLTKRISGILEENYDEDGTPNDSYAMDDPDDPNNKLTIGDAYAYIVVLAGIIIYTIIFAIKYLKREFTIIFLILLGPVSCITYPIDKIGDGKAQAFNRWFSEFLYQVIIQPFHLLLYVVLVGSSVELAKANVLYAIVCFAVMIPAEKFIKEMFGFKDKLGSPMGDMMKANMARDAMNKIMNKAKGSGSGGSKDDGKENNSTPNEAPPKTVDQKDLVGGNAGDNGDDGESPKGSTSPRTQLPEGEGETGTVTENGDAEAVDESIGNGDNGKDDLIDEEQGEEDSEGQQSNKFNKDGEKTDLNPEEEKKGIKEKMKNAKNKISNSKVMAIHNQRMSKKYGSTSRGKRWINRGKKFAKGALKGAGIGAAAAALATGAALTGHGREAAAVLGGTAALAGKAGLRTIKGFKGAPKDYINAYRSDKSKEKKLFNEFRADPKQIDKAVYSYRKNHGGEDPGYKELNQEMEDRFNLSRYGLSDDQIDAAIGNYQQLREDRIEDLEENGNLNDETWFDADHKALEETVFATKLADDYSKKDFRSEKTMKEAVDSLTKRFHDLGVKDENLAQSSAITYLKEAAKIKGADINLPAGYETVDVPVSRGRLNVQASLGIQGSNLSSNQIERLNNITLRLRDQGYSDVEIQAIAESAAASGATSTQVINKYATKMEFLENKGQQAHAAKVLEKMGKEVTPENIKEEMKDRLVLKETFNVRPQDVSHMRNEEIKSIPTSQVKAARDFAIKNRGQLGNSARMEKEKQVLIEQLEKGGSSNAKKDAENIIKLAEQYAGTSTTNKGKGTKGKKNK